MEADFAKEDWFQSQEQRLRSEFQTIFLWEGVTLYLSEADVRKTLKLLPNSAWQRLDRDIYGFHFQDV